MTPEEKEDLLATSFSGEADQAQTTVEYKQALSRVMRLLARREYSEQEIRRKLGDEYPATILAVVIERCRALDWLNEARMMAVFIRSRASRGYGPMRVMQELRFKGLSAEPIKLALEACEIDWFAMAKQQAVRKVNEPAILDRVARGKLLAFLQRRGFTSEQARYALTPSDEE